MSDNLPGTRPLPGRREPPPVPPGHEPPPVPEQERELAITARHEPPPVPPTYDAPSISRDEQSIEFVVEESRYAELAGPGFRSPSARVLEIESDATADEVVVTAGPRPARQPSSFLPWLALSLALLCIPPSIVAALFLVLGFGLWPLVLICSLLAVCFGRFAKERAGPSANIAGLAMQLGRGFFAIGLVGLATIAMAAAIYGITTMQSLSERWRESNAILRWGTQQVEAVKAFFTGPARNDPAAPSPSPAPSSPP